METIFLKPSYSRLLAHLLVYILTCPRGGSSGCARCSAEGEDGQGGPAEQRAHPEDPREGRQGFTKGGGQGYTRERGFCKRKTPPDSRNVSASDQKAGGGEGGLTRLTRITVLQVKNRN